MSQNKIGVSRKMSIEYPYKQLPCQTQGGFLQTALSAVTRRSRSCSSPVLLRRVTPDRVLAFERSRCLGGRFPWFDREISMSQNKNGVSRKMSIEYPYKQLPCQTQGGFLQTALSTVTRRSRSCSSPVLLRRVTPDRVLAFRRLYRFGGSLRAIRRKISVSRRSEKSETPR